MQPNIVICQHFQTYYTSGGRPPGALVQALWLYTESIRYTTFGIFVVMACHIASNIVFFASAVSLMWYYTHTANPDSDRDHKGPALAVDIHLKDHLSDHLNWPSVTG